MTAPKDDIALRKAAMFKAARSAVRLKHSIAADAEIPPAGAEGALLALGGRYARMWQLQQSGHGEQSPGNGHQVA